MVAQPRRWDIKFIRKFMITFGIVSSLFDFMTFGLLLLLDVSVEQFRTAWFLESVVSAALIVFVVRSSKAFFISKPGKYLVAATLDYCRYHAGFTLYTDCALSWLCAIAVIFIGLAGCDCVLYISTAEIAKHLFYRLVKSQPGRSG